jgi:hypothetical protein
MDPDRLTAVAREMVGYVPPPRSPPDPSSDEIAQFPVSLRYLAVPGVGAAVSQTVYIGREDRAAEIGRFGNYFSHVLVAVDTDHFAPGHHPIETWGSPVWRNEATHNDGVLLDDLPLGRRTLAEAEQSLADGARRSWLPFLYEWLEDALADRTRIVILDDSVHAWAWVAAIALRLPAGLRDQLTFDTYAGDPERSRARICVADPATDRSLLSRRELTGEMQVVDLSTKPPVPRRLLARAIAAGREYEPLSGVDDELSVGGLAVKLATEGEEMIALEKLDLAQATSVLSSLPAGERSEYDLVDRAAQLVNGALDTQLDLQEIDRPILERLWNLTAEQSADTPGTVVAVATRLALRRPELTDNVQLPVVEHDTVSPDVVGDAISLLTDAELDDTTQRHHLELLRRLRLVGANTGLDRRIGRVAARQLRSNEVANWLGQIADRPDGRAVAEHAIRTACSAEQLDQPTLDFLAIPSIGKIHEQLCGPEDAFPITYARAAVLTQAQPQLRRRTLERALDLARTPTEAESLIDVVYGDRLSPATLQEVLSVLSATDRRPSDALIDSGWAILADQDPFSGDPSVRALATDLHRLDSSGSSRSIYVTIWLEQERLGMPPDEWIAEIGKWTQTLTDNHLRGLLRGSARDAFTPGAPLSHHRMLVESGIATLKDPFFECYWEELTWALRDTNNVELAADVVRIWAAQGVPEQVGDEALEGPLVNALKPWNEQARDDIGARLRGGEGAGLADYWGSWCEQFPASGAIGRTMGKLFTRRPRD